MSRRQGLRALLGLFWKQARTGMLVGALMAALTVLAGVALLGLSGWFISATAIAGLTMATAVAFNVFGPSAGIRLLALGRTACRYAERIVTHDVTLGVLASLRQRLFLGWSAPQAASRLLAHPATLLFRITTDVDALDALYLRVLVPVMVAVLSSLFVGVLLGVMDIYMGLFFALGLLAAGCLPSYWAFHQAQSLMDERVLHLENFRRESIDLVSGQVELLMTGTLPEAFERQQQTQKKLADHDTRLGRIDAYTTFWQAVATQALLAVALLAAWYLTREERISVPQATLLVLVVLAASEPFAALRRGALDFARALIAVDRLAPRLAVAPVSVPTQYTHNKHEYNSEPTITLRDVSVVHPNAATPVLSGLSLKIRSGEHVAIIGASGSGKTSLLNVLAQELPVYSGSAVLGESGLLTQATYIFHDTVQANLRVARIRATESEMWHALSVAGLDHDIHRMSHGLSTVLGESGTGLSGGQARRLALARLVLHNVPVWLLDEPTDGLDTAMADRVMQAVMQAAKTRTVVMATHLYREARFADRLLLMKGGSIHADVRRGEPAFETLLFSLRPD